ncbi:MAG: putative Ig domain-containing protein, partial [Acidobacteriota bacterium]
MIRRALALFPAAGLLALAHPLAAGVGPVGQAFVPITACRSVDTRGPAGPNGGPALGANALRILPVAGTCGVPANALGLVVNLTVVNPAAPGYAQLFAGDAPVPPTTVLGFKANNTRAGFAFVALAANGSGTVGLANGSAGSADYILDVEGYFIPACVATINVTNPATSGGTVNAAFSQAFTSSGGVGAMTYATASPLPPGLTLAVNGTLSGTPTQPGTFPITVTATDQNGCTGTGPTYTLVIACQTISVTIPAVATGTANTPFSQTFTQTGGVGTTTFSTVSALPIGMTLAASGVLSGTPTQAGGFDIVVTATDANGCTGAGATYHLVIACQTIAVTNPAAAAGTVNAPFSQTFTQAGAIGSATFTTVSPLPTGLTLAANGTLSGTPLVKGSFPIVVKVTDGNLCTGTGATYTLVIGCQTIAVTNPGVTTATAGAAFSQAFTASNTVGAVTFATASALPTGLTLAANGVLSGTPTQTGSFPIVVVATDANGCAGIGATYTLVVSCQTYSIGPA